MTEKPPFRYHISRFLFSGHRFLRWIGAWPSTVGFRILLFHDISKDQMGAFERFLRRILSIHQVIKPSEAEGFLTGNASIATNGRIPVLLTFDDGFKSQERLTKAVLDQYGVKAIFFVCPGLIDVPRDQQREAIVRHVFDGRSYGADLPDEMALMSWSDLENIIASGHTIGSHTTHHQRLSIMGQDELQNEVAGSAEILSSRLGSPIRWFAYPFGDIESINVPSYEVIRKNYEFCCSGIRGFNVGGAHPLTLLRDQMDPISPVEYQEFILSGGLDLYYWTRAKRLRSMVGQSAAGNGLNRARS